MVRELTLEEKRILGLIQVHYGSQNDAGSVTWVDEDEAVLFVTNRSGDVVLMANLTNLAAWRLDNTIASDDELKRDWLQIADA